MCAIGREVLKIIEEENLQNNAHVLGKRVKEGLLLLKEKYECIGDIKGKGLMFGIEFVKTQTGKEPDRIAMHNFMERIKDYGILCTKSGLNANIARFGPPMCINEADIDFFLNVCETTLKEMSEGLVNYF